MIVSKSMVFGIVGGIIVAIILLFLLQDPGRFINPIHEDPESRRLEKYAIPQLRKTTFSPSKIVIQEPIEKNQDVLSYTFYFYDGDKKVSGLLNAPKASGSFPIILMFRGYVDKEIYSPGIGTQRGAEFFAKNGFITLSPDFLGYGSSDEPSIDSLESRFQTYTTALTLFASLPNLNEALASVSGELKADPEKVAVWAHSNGGQIALTALEATGKEYPTSLWAPVTHPFPESILFFADEMEDGGAYLRGITADFVQRYNPRLYSPPQYLTWIKAPIQLHQGTADDAVPLQWSNTFADKMEGLDKDFTYFIYEDEDHNFTQGSWATLVARDLQFFRKYLDL